MNKVPIFPLSHKTISVVAIIFGVTLFVLVFCLSPSPPEYKYVGTQVGEVVEVRVPTARDYRQSPVRAVVEFEDGTTGNVLFSSNRNILKGQIVDVDIHQAEGKKPRYHLAQERVQP